MSSIQNVSPEELVKLFYHYQEALASDFDLQPGQRSAPSREQTPPNERKLRIAAARLALLELASTAPQDRPNHEYYAKPGRSGMGLLRFPSRTTRSRAEGGHLAYLVEHARRRS